MRVRIRVLVALTVAFAAARAEAIPAFARKYGMSCTACHVAWPILNQQGQNFRDNGYRFKLGKDDPVTVSPAYVPLSLRTTAAYQYTRTTNQPSDQGPITTQSGGVPLPPGVDLLSAGTISDDVSYLVVVTGFSPSDNAAFVESAWARLDDLGGTGWLNAKIGKFELDQPASSHRGITLTSGYAVYGAHPAGSLVGFDLGENQVGVELDGHDARSLTRYSISLVSANGAESGSTFASRNAWSAPLLYAHVQKAFELDSAVLPWVRLGALGAVGWWPTSFSTLTPSPPPGETVPEQPQIVPGTGADHKRYYRAGAELSWMLGYPSTPAFFTVSYINGREEAGLAPSDQGSGDANHFNGGFAEVDWVPFTSSSYDATPWVFFARYDLVRYARGPGDLDGGTFGIRRYLALGPRASAAVHAEFHVDRVRGVGWVDPATNQALDVVTQAAMLGLDFDF
ncbi:hypothetical protein [Anaeromyxobacter diazotrophicus]|uniref:Cytochrome c domain-containing protein n=1 Tax=Anaeromyxobacter diazotrophicus TaxID=2590199 RepID=A0A7I9VK71_9BACT|nr:hypothetical protein [Anaeromyxobacter diazotrophicus]GEJ56792.1 hypothetical protein AMYX_15330 [Anaeromyxobacter diazotrophicus]